MANKPCYLPTKPHWYGSVLQALPLLLLIIGVLMLGYPSISNCYYQLREKETVESTNNAISEQDTEQIQEEIKACEAYNARLNASHTTLTDPFEANTQHISNSDYYERLNLAGNGIMATVCIPSIEVELPLYHSTSDDVLAHGLGHMQASSLPCGGRSSHAVIAGHSGLTSMKVFDNLDKVTPGDCIYVDVAGQHHTYTVYDCETVLPTETNKLIVQEGCDIITLVTCVPYGINSHRLLVHAKRSETPDEQNVKESVPDVNPQIAGDLLSSIIASIACVGFALTTPCVYLIKRHREKRRLKARLRCIENWK